MSNLVNRAGGNGADNSMGGEGTDLGSEAEKAVESARASGQGYGKSGAAGAAEVTDEVAEVTGNRYYTGGSKDHNGEDFHPVVQEKYGNVAEDMRNGNAHGNCAEASLCSQILKDFEQATGETVNSVEQADKILAGTRMDIRNTSNKAGVNSPKEACSSCKEVQRETGIEDVNQGH